MVFRRCRQPATLYCQPSPLVQTYSLIESSKKYSSNYPDAQQIRGIVKEKHENMFLFKILFVILQANYQKKQEKAYGKDSNDNSLGGDGR